MDVLRGRAQMAHYGRAGRDFWKWTLWGPVQVYYVSPEHDPEKHGEIPTDGPPQGFIEHVARWFGVYKIERRANA